MTGSCLSLGTNATFTCLFAFATRYHVSQPSTSVYLILHEVDTSLLHYLLIVIMRNEDYIIILVCCSQGSEGHDRGAGG